jgi:hypothetical protein
VKVILHDISSDDFRFAARIVERLIEYGPAQRDLIIVFGEAGRERTFYACHNKASITVRRSD